MARFETTPLREAVYFFYKPLMANGDVSPRWVAEVTGIPEGTLRAQLCWYRKKHGGKEKAALAAASFMSKHSKAFDELQKQLSCIQPNQLLSLVYGLYHGYDASHVRFAGYKPGQWRERFMETHRYDPADRFPFCGVVGLGRKERTQWVV